MVAVYIVSYVTYIKSEKRRKVYDRIFNKKGYKMKRLNRINVRLSAAELGKLNTLAASYGETQSGAFRSLLTVAERQDSFERNQKKSAAEISGLRSDILDLKTQLLALNSWLKASVE